VTTGSGTVVPICEQMIGWEMSTGTRLVRSFSIGPSDEDLYLLAHAERAKFVGASGDAVKAIIDRGTNALMLVVRVKGDAVLEKKMLTLEGAGNYWHEIKNDSEVTHPEYSGQFACAYLRIPAHKSEVPLQLVSGIFASKAEAEKASLAILNGFPGPVLHYSVLTDKDKDDKATAPSVVA